MRRFAWGVLVAGICFLTAAEICLADNVIRLGNGGGANVTTLQFDGQTSILTQEVCFRRGYYGYGSGWGYPAYYGGYGYGYGYPTYSGYGYGGYGYGGYASYGYGGYPYYGGYNGCYSYGYPYGGYYGGYGYGYGVSYPYYGGYGYGYGYGYPCRSEAGNVPPATNLGAIPYSNGNPEVVSPVQPRPTVPLEGRMVSLPRETSGDAFTMFVRGTRPVTPTPVTTAPARYEYRAYGE